MLADLIENDTGISKEIKWDVNLWNGNLTGNREYPRRQRKKL